MIYYGQYLYSIIVESLDYGYALKGGIFMEVRPRYALWEYDDEALPDYELDLTDTINKEMGRKERMSLKEFVDTGRAFLLLNAPCWKAMLVIEN